MGVSSGLLDVDQERLELRRLDVGVAHERGERVDQVPGLGQPLEAPVQRQPDGVDLPSLDGERVDALAGEASVRWLGIASGLWATESDLADYRKEHGVRIPIALDESGELFRAFDVMQVPTAVLIGADGRFVRRNEPKDFETAATLRATINTAH